MLINILIALQPEYKSSNTSLLLNNVFVIAEKRQRVNQLDETLEEIEGILSSLFTLGLPRPQKYPRANVKPWTLIYLEEIQ